MSGTLRVLHVCRTKGAACLSYQECCMSVVPRVLQVCVTLRVLHVSVTLRVQHVCRAEGAACVGAALLSWAPYAEVVKDAVASCSPLPRCRSFEQNAVDYFVGCSARGRVIAVYVPPPKPSSWHVAPGPSCTGSIH
jgi:hypothetical protein